MRKLFIIAAVLVTVASWGLFLRNMSSDPTRAWRRSLAESLAKVEDQRPSDETFVLKAELDYRRLETTIESKPALWTELVPPPPPPPPPAPPAPPPPNLAAMLKGVSLSAGQMGIGEKARIPIKVPGKPGKGFYGVGDTINGLSIKTISEKEVVFSLVKDGKEYTLVLERP